MAVHTEPRIYAFTADADLSAKQYHLVKVGTDQDHVAIGAANTDKCIGVLMNAPELGESAEVALQGGGAKVKLGETVVAGDELVCAADGRAELANVLGDWVVCIAMDGGVANDIVKVEVVQHKAVEAE